MLSDFSGMLLLVVRLALLFDFTNGWHDSANAIATVVSTRVLTPAVAVLMAGLLNVAGAFMSTPVAKMGGGGIVDPAAGTQGAGWAPFGGAVFWKPFHPVVGVAPSPSPSPVRGGRGGS